MSKSTECCVVLNSGGFDSISVLHEMKKQGFKKIHTLYFNYGQKTKDVEAMFSRYWSEVIGAEYHRLPISIPWATASLLGNSDNPYLPMRNLIFLSYAISLAEQVGASHVCYGAHYGNTYPDNSKHFIRTLDKLSKKACYVRIYAPFENMTKFEVFRYSLESFNLHPLTDNVWSCDERTDYRCGICPHCADIALAITKGIIPATPLGGDTHV